MTPKGEEKLLGLLERIAKALEERNVNERRGEMKMEKDVFYGQPPEPNDGEAPTGTRRPRQSAKS